MSRPAPHSHYPTLAALCFAFSVAVAPFVGSAWVTSASPFVRGAVLLFGPLSFLAWVVLTIRSLHLLGLAYWSLASTYVILVSELAAAVLALVAGSLHTPGSVCDWREALLWTAAMTCLAGLTWSASYNWRKAGSLQIAVSVTVLQLITGSLIVLILMLRSRPPEKSRAD